MKRHRKDDDYGNAMVAAMKNAPYGCVARKANACRFLTRDKAEAERHWAVCKRTVA